jgi:arylsulfatase
VPDPPPSPSASGAASSAATGATAPSPSTRRKNVLILMSDEQSWDTLGHNGNPVTRTPHLDALAAQGASFEHCYTPYPLCCPARTSLWTGQMPHNHHVVGNWRHIHPGLRDDGLVHAFLDAGYHTLYTGKWHVPGTTPARLGFADTAAIPAVLQGRDRGRYIEPYREYVQAHGYQLLPNHIENLTEHDLAQLKQPGKAPCGTADIAIEHYLETWQTGQFLEHLDARPADKPFFAVCSYNAPHFPMIVPAPYDRLIDPADIILPESLSQGPGSKPAEVVRSHYAEHAGELDEGEWRRLIAHYLGFCALIDEQVGRVMDYLGANGLLENTIVVFTADHGDMMGAHGLLEKGYPLHYEPSLRLPLIVVDPDVKRSAGGGGDPGNGAGPVRPEGFVTLLDVIPTVAELAGVKLPETHEGRSVVAALSDPHAPLRPYAISETFTFDGAESGGGEYTSFEEFKARNATTNISIRTPDARYVFRWSDVDEYYDLAVDPGEMENRINDPAYQERVERLRSTLLEDASRSNALLGCLVRERMCADDQVAVAAVPETPYGARA